MKKRFLTAVLFTVVLVLVLVQGASAGFGVKYSAEVNVNGLDDYYMALQRYNNVGDRDIKMIVRDGITNDQIQVVLFIAEQAGVKPNVILKLRKQGMSWADIAWTFNIGPDAFYVPVAGKVRGPVYGPIYSLYSKPARQWRRIRLTDQNIIDLVNLRFISDHYGYTPNEVIKMRHDGRSYFEINRDIYRDQNRNARGWKDYNNTWHDRKANWQPPAKDNSWRDRENYWKDRDRENNWRHVNRAPRENEPGDRNINKNPDNRGFNDKGVRGNEKGGNMPVKGNVVNEKEQVKDNKEAARATEEALKQAEKNKKDEDRMHGKENRPLESGK